MELEDGHFHYEQETGRFVYRSGQRVAAIAVCYAGAPGFVNDSRSDHIRQKGPLPAGHYRIVEAKHPRFAAPAFRLRPFPATETYGRAGFWIHGDNRSGNRTASSGCIVMGYYGRRTVADCINLYGRNPVLIVTP